MRFPGLAVFGVIFGVVMVAMPFFFVGVAHADTTCALSPTDFAKIAAVQSDPSFTPTEEVIQELVVRKQLLSQTITCAQTEVSSLQSVLLAATTTYGTQNIQSQLLSDLDGASDFYTIEKSKLNNVGIAGSKEIASEILAWRAGTYTPLEGKINNYLLWTQDQSFFNTAQARMDETQNAVNFLESTSASQDLQNAFNTTYASFQSAKAQNAAAESALAQSLAPDQSLTLIKQSLDSLSSTYQGFFAVSDAIKALLPQP
jgi:hypothetical protein